MPNPDDRLHEEAQIEHLQTGGRGLGRIEDRKPEQQEYMIRQLLPQEVELPDRKYWWDNSGVLDQGNTGTCVGHAFAHRFEDSPTTHPGSIDPFEIYRWAADNDPWTENNGPEYDYDFGTSADAAALGLLKAGKIDSFWWEWAEDPDDWQTVFNIVKQWVLTEGSVCIGMPYYQSEFNPRWTEVAPGQWRWALVIDEKEGWFVGGHEMVIDGWHDWGDGYDVARLKQSWGPSWGVNGRVSMTAATLKRKILEGADFTLIEELAS